MLVDISELSGRALNYAVAVCKHGQPTHINDSAFVWETGIPGGAIIVQKSRFFVEHGFNPSGNWAHGGPLIPKHEVNLTHDADGCIASIHAVFDEHPDIDVRIHGSNELEAVCRCVVKYRNRCKDEIEIPDELMEAA